MKQVFSHRHLLTVFFLFFLWEPNSLAHFNEKPVAHAGKDIFELRGKKITLANNSYDPENQALEYRWSMMSRPTGSIAILSDPSDENPFFIADQEGIFIIRLRVSDGVMVSEYDDVVIRVVANRKPIALVNADQSLNPGQMAQLDASSSFDLEQSDLIFHWAIDVAPEGSSAYIFFPDKATTGFIPDLPGLYLLRVFVSDSFLVDEAYVRVRVEGVMMQPPTADAGNDRVVATGQPFFLNGAGSSDEQELELTYTWDIETAPTASQATLNNANTVMPSFTPDVDGDYYISLQVNNGSLNSAPDLIKVTAQKRPRAIIKTNSAALRGSTIIIDATESIDPKGAELSYKWTLEKPSGSLSALSSSSDSSISLTTDLAGSYIVSLVASSEHLTSLPVQHTITVAGLKEQKVIVGSFVSFNSDTFGSNSKVLGWDIISKPSGSRARLLSNQSPGANLRVDAPGSYVILWRLAQGESRFEEYSVVHGYSSGGQVVFGPQSFEFDPLCVSFFRGCKDMSWNFLLSDLTKSYAIEIEYSNIETGFVYLNNDLIAGRHDLSSSGTLVKQVSLLASNKVFASFVQNSSSTATIQVKEMAFSGTELSPPTLSISPLQVTQGQTITGQVMVSDVTGAMHSYSILFQGSQGQATINATGELSYNSRDSSKGADLVFIKVQSSSGLSQVVVAKITISDSIRGLK